MLQFIRPRCTFDFYELRKLALCSQVNSCISFVTICWAKHVFSCRLNSIYSVVCIWFTLLCCECAIFGPARTTTTQNGTMLLFLLRGGVYVCVQLMSFSHFAFCAKLTKIYSSDTTAKMQSFFSLKSSRSTSLCSAGTLSLQFMKCMFTITMHVIHSSEIFEQAHSVVKILESCERKTG